MLNRLTISALLKSAIALCGVAVITLLAYSVSDSWGRLRTASHAAAATEASSHLFTALSQYSFRSRQHLPRSPGRQSATGYNAD